MGINTEYRIAKYQQIPCQRVNQVGFDGSLAGLIRRVVNTALQRLWSWGQSFFNKPIEINEFTRNTHIASIHKERRRLRCTT